MLWILQKKFKIIDSFVKEFYDHLSIDGSEIVALPYFSTSKIGDTMHYFFLFNVSANNKDEISYRIILFIRTFVISMYIEPKAYKFNQKFSSKIIRDSNSFIS